MSSSKISVTKKYATPLLIRNSLIFVIFVALFFYIYADTVQWLWHYWTVEQNWQFVVPIAFVYMLWDRQDLYSDLTREPNILWGAILLSLACMLLVAGQVSSTQTVREVSLVLSIFALVFLFFGSRYVQRLFWPLAYLILMTSLSSDLLDTLRYPLKLISATVAAEMLQYSGYAVFRDGTFLQLPHITLEVADSCSGLNQLVSAIAIGIPIAFTMLNLWWKRLAIIFLSIAFGLVMNWVRVFLIAVWHYDSAKVEIHGPYGIYELPFIFLIGVFLTFIVALLMADKKDARHHGNQLAESGRVFSWGNAMKHSAAYMVAVLVLSATALYLHFWKVEPVTINDGFAQFPVTIAGFQGQPIDKLDKPFHSGLAHDELILRFTGPSGAIAKVYVGYFQFQNQEQELIDYRYNWLHAGASRIVLPSIPAPILMKMNHVKTGGGVVTVFFNYDVNGRNLVDPVKVKLASLVDVLTARRSNGAIIIIQFEGILEYPSAEIEEFLQQVVRATQAVLRTGDQKPLAR